MKRVLVGPYPFGESDPEALARLERAGLEIVRNPHKRKLKAAELPALLAGVQAWIASTEPVSREVLASTTALQIVARTGVGLDNVDIEAARERGIAVTYTPEGPAASVAELTIGLLLDLARDVTRVDRTLRSGKWDRRTGFLLEKKTLGILGCGRIGRRVARFARAFDMRVLAHDIAPDASWAKSAGVDYVSFDELLKSSDAITVHVPLTPQTRSFLSEKELARMKPGALLVNTSRGEVLDEGALEKALVSGTLGGAALDVFHEEPYTGPLARLENVVLTAHIGSCSREGRRAMEHGAVDAVLAFFEGKPLPGRVC
jgi:D-3-phosphoglycerate dehydrogenase